MSTKEYEIKEMEQISQSPESVYSDADFHKKQKKVLRKIDIRILSLTAIAYMLNHIDRTNLANARIMNTDVEGSSMVDQLDLHDGRFGHIITAFYAAYIVFEIPSNLLLKRFGPSKHISRIVIGWGIVTVCSAAVQTYEGMIVNRIALAVAESGFFPGILYYFTFWYNDDERASRFAFFVASSSLSGAFSGLLATGCSYLNGLGHPALSGWRWLNIIEGVPTVIVGILIYFLLPDYPETAKFLTEEERQIAVQRLGESATKKDEGKINMSSIVGVLKQWDFWFFALMWLLLANGTAAFSFFAPSIINDLDPDFQGVKAQLISIPPSVLAFVLTITCGYLSDRTRNRPGFIILGVVLVSCGYLILAVDKKVVGPRLLAVFLLALANIAIIPLAAFRQSLQRLQSSNSDSTAVGFSGSATVAIANASGLIAPAILDSSLRLDYKCYILLALFIVAGIQAIFCWWWFGAGVELKKSNNEKEESSS
ncbi:hypothetical protein E3P92_03241 [Wallemia ichthyophaga]|uniref:Major facilitator superfamily (MFS) profile domain-containing protein n=1 Tax=Wallemia ichthyophaga TaxID=245174 RepID=A0A4T0E8L9_WALIC|nr:hypothetical protein E3P91_03150 [Wallemia ichthyophaga]TIA79488.1 hypothetical protein E3P98_03250 [Wallemia ichthyophaga]TIA88727.1 hypothetical protein E3P97_03415 [Wallemia ichthyophaga]TIA96670.1 hypothetical protein E3P95_03166 [Wallemia ichthyophaga]TIA97880.1 hypothetical protein E3P94_03126 [Wallemia ichthyophaga]